MEVFLFPLVNVTLFPSSTKPLNVFEPRYITMIKDSIESKTPIAIGFIDDPSKVTLLQEGDPVPFVRSVAGYGMAHIVEERPNGTLLVFIQGLGKIKLGEVKSIKNSYLVCDGEVISENLAVESYAQPDLMAILKILLRWVRSHIQDKNQQDIFLQNLRQPEEIIGAFAMYLVRDYDLQQMVLEYDNINDKISFLYRLVQSNELTT